MTEEIDKTCTDIKTITPNKMKIKMETKKH